MPGVTSTGYSGFARNGKLQGVRFAEKRADIDEPTVDAYRKRMFDGDFVFSVARDFVRSCTTPMLVMPGSNLDHPTVIGREIASLAPNAEKLEDWRYPADVVPATVSRIWSFLKAHTA